MSSANPYSTAQWQRVFTELLNQPESLFSNQYQDCPLCGSAGDFKGQVMDPGYHMVCNNCGGLDGKGGIITHFGFASRVLNLDRDAAKGRVAQFLGVALPKAPVPAKARPQRQSALDAALGRWPQLLQDLAGLSPDQLTDRHQPCPACGGTDRYRWTNDLGPGGFYCNQCGGKDRRGGAGSGIDLLMRINGWDFQQSLARIEQHLGITPATAPARHSRRPARIPDHPPAGTPPPPLGSAVAQFPYYDATDLDQPAFWVQRIPLPPRDGKSQKLFIQRTWLDSRWHRPSKRDAFTSEWPSPRPLFRLPELLRGDPVAPVLIAEGEGTVIAGAQLLPHHIVIGWCGGTAGIGHTDWSPLAGRTVILWPDADDPGRQCMARLAPRLQSIGCTVSIVNPPDSCPPKWDLADALSSGWAPEQVANLLAENTRTIRPVLPSAPPQPTRQQPQPGGQPQPPPAEQSYAPAFGRPQRLEAGELLAMLRVQAQGGCIRYNTFSQQLEINGEVLEGAERYYLTLAEQGFKVSKDLAIDCLLKIAHENTYDPVALYLDHVAATVAPAYIGGLATAYLRPEDAATIEPTLYDHMLRCTLIGAVRRVFEPGCKHDTACVLMGDQGARKSSFWATLGGAFFSDALRDISTKDDLMILHRSWIMEWAELDHITGRKHAGQIKSFLSQATDIFRRPYGKEAGSFPRRGIIVGSTNRQTGFLVDETGNRRFWVIPTTRTEANPIDTITLHGERDAIWSAAVHAYRAGEANYLPTELAQQVVQENEGYRVDSPWLPAIQQWLDQRILGEPITTERILLEAIQKPIERQTRADQMAIADLLSSLGYTQKRVRHQGNRARIWTRL